MSNQQPILRIGILADIQMHTGEYDWGVHNLRSALKLLAPEKPDILLNVGDIADGAYEEWYQTYGNIVKEYFPAELPIQFACAGNHDFWIHGDQKIEPVYGQFCRGIGQQEANPYHLVIKDFDFIAMSEPGNDYSQAMIDLLEAEIRKAVARDDRKPIFVVTHYPPAKTMSGSNCKSGQENLREMFNRYPQVVSLSGHTHYPIEDERCIWQGEFTAVTCSTLAYLCMTEEKYANSTGGIIPFAREGVQAMYMEIFEDHFEIHRYNVEDQREIKPDRLWSIPYPFDPAAAPYRILERKMVRKAPQFIPGTQIYLRFDYGYAFLIFDGAKHDDFVQSYRLRISEKLADGSFGNAAEFDFVSNFYRLQRNQDHRQIIRLPGEHMKKNTDYRFEIFPVESFGNTGTPIVMETHVGNYPWKPTANLPPQE